MEGFIYLDGLTKNDASEYFWQQDGSVVGTELQPRRLHFDGSAVSLATDTLTLSRIDKENGLFLASIDTTVQILPASAGSGETPKVMAIGDSTTEAGHYTQQLTNIASTDSMGIQLIGTIGSTSNRNEGRGGWTVAKYLTEESPYIYSGAWDFTQFLTDNSLDTPEYVYVHLGINDMSQNGRDNDIAATAKALEVLIDMETFVTNLTTSLPLAKIVLNLVIPPGAEDFGFKWRYKRAITIYNNLLIARFKGREASRIYINGNFLAYLDNKYAYPTSTQQMNPHDSTTVETYQTDYIHPKTFGYYMMGDAMWAHLKYMVDQT